MHDEFISRLLGKDTVNQPKAVKKTDILYSKEFETSVVYRYSYKFVEKREKTGDVLYLSLFFNDISLKCGKAYKLTARMKNKISYSESRTYLVDFAKKAQNEDLKLIKDAFTKSYQLAQKNHSAKDMKKLNELSWKYLGQAIK